MHLVYERAMGQMQAVDLLHRMLYFLMSLIGAQLIHKSEEHLRHSVFICLSSITQSFFLFFTFFMTSIAFKVHINDN